MKATKVPLMKPGRRKVGTNVFSVFVSIKRISNWKLKFVNVFFQFILSDKITETKSKNKKTSSQRKIEETIVQNILKINEGNCIRNC